LRSALVRAWKKASRAEIKFVACGGIGAFLCVNSAYIGEAGSTGYGDKLQRAIGAADPGAVPGGSTIIGAHLWRASLLTGPN